MSLAPFHALARRLVAVLCMGLLSIAANVTADAPGATAALPRQSIEHTSGKCMGDIVRTAAPGTFVVRPSPMDGRCGCTLLTGRADRQSAALERRVSNFERDPHCEGLGYAQLDNDAFGPGFGSSGGRAIRDISPAVLLLVGSASQLGGKRPADSAGG